MNEEGAAVVFACEAYKKFAQKAQRFRSAFDDGVRLFADLALAIDIRVLDDFDEEL
jgi:hypothetical protein